MSSEARASQQALHCFTRQALAATGADPETVERVAENLVQGELHGLGSHGVSRLLAIYCRRLQQGGINPRPEVRVVRRRGSVAVIDGDNGAGAVVGERAMDLAISLAREHASGWVAARNSNHYGAAFLFARRALNEGMIGITTTSAVPMVVPYGGRARALGTNPLCVAIPGGRRGPIILDMATSTAARGKVQLLALQGLPVPEGWTVDEQGLPTTNSATALEGAMTPLGGHKGYGLALVVEVLSSLLSGAAFGAQIGGLFTDLNRGQRMGHFFGALDVAAFGEPEAHAERMDALIDYVKSSPRAPGVEEILVPGEPEARKAALYAREGIPLPLDVLQTLDELTVDLGIARLERRPPA